MQLNRGQQIHYRLIAGAGDRPYLIFLHEGLGCVAMWKGFPDRLCGLTGCPGLVYDRLGYGQSSPASGARTINYLHDYALNELPKVIEAVIPAKPYILIGHSDGGSISLILGAAKPPLLKAIITEAAHVFVELETVAGIEVAHAAYTTGKLNGLTRYHGDKTDTIFSAWADTWRSEWFARWNIEDLLPSIACPVLAIQGADDKYGTARQVDSIVSKSSGVAVPMLVEDCGHAPHQEQPEKVLQAMADFILQHA